MAAPAAPKNVDVRNLTAAATLLGCPAKERRCPGALQRLLLANPKGVLKAFVDW